MLIPGRFASSGRLRSPQCLYRPRHAYGILQPGGRMEQLGCVSEKRKMDSLVRGCEILLHGGVLHPSIHPVMSALFQIFSSIAS